MSAATPAGKPIGRTPRQPAGRDSSASNWAAGVLYARDRGGLTPDRSASSWPRLSQRQQAGTATAAVARRSDHRLKSSTTGRCRPHSALGLSAFYIALLALMCGFLAATIINATVDAATGYATTEVGPKWRQRAPAADQPLANAPDQVGDGRSRSPACSRGCVLVVAAGLLGMDAPNAGLPMAVHLALCRAQRRRRHARAVRDPAAPRDNSSPCSSSSTSGSRPPVAPSRFRRSPAPLKVASQIDPLRQILAGTRSILYFGAGGDAGLTRGLIAAAAGLICSGSRSAPRS